MEHVEIYTRQNENSIFELLDKGRIINKEVYIRLHFGPDADYFVERYRTFVEICEQVLPRPEGIEFPIWGSISKNNCLRPEHNSVVYCLKVPKDQVIYLDGLKWDYVLNYLYVPRNDEDNKRHNQELNRLGFKNGHQLFERYNQGLYPELEAQIVHSWSRVLEIDNWSEFVVQGNLWMIQPEWITRVLHPGEDLLADASRELDLEYEAQLVRERQATREVVY